MFSFHLQVQMLKSLNHPNILHFIGILYQEGKVLTVITGMSHDSHMMDVICLYRIHWWWYSTKNN